MPDYPLDWIHQTEGLLQHSDLPERLLRADEELPRATAASVLVPLFRRDDDWHLLYIRRVSNVRDRHSGQVAFPGGRRDPADKNATAVALREAEEEVGLSAAHVEIVGLLDEYRTSSNFIVTPVVGSVPWPYSYTPQVTEVDRIFSIPLSWLANASNHELRNRQIQPDGASSQAPVKVVYFSPYDGEILWGATARMTLSFLKALHEKRIVLPSG